MPSTLCRTKKSDTRIEKISGLKTFKGELKRNKTSDWTARGDRAESAVSKLNIQVGEGNIQLDKQRLQCLHYRYTVASRTGVLKSSP